MAIAFLLSVGAGPVLAQDKPAVGAWTVPSVSREDYARAASFRSPALAERVYDLNVQPMWFGDDAFWYRAHGRDRTTWYRVQTAPPAREPLFDHGRMAELVSARLDSTVSADRLPLDYLAYEGGDTVTVGFGRERIAVSIVDFGFFEVGSGRSGQDAGGTRSPDGQWTAFGRDSNVWIRSEATGDEYPLSSAGRKGYEYGGSYGWGEIIRGEGDERPARFNVRWTPDSRYLTTAILDVRNARKMYLLDWSVDSLYRPNLLGYYRGSPGDTAMVHEMPVIFDVSTRREIRPDIPRSTHINAPDLRWTEDGRLFAVSTLRGFKERRIDELDPATGAARRLFTDQSETNVHGASFFLRILDSGREAVLSSERSGWNHLYLLDLDTGDLRQITSGGYAVGGIERIDESDRLLWFTASGREPGRNPYHTHLYIVSLDGGEPRLLTPEDAHHLVRFSGDGHSFVDSWSTATRPPVHALRSSTDGGILLDLGAADVGDLVDMGWLPPVVFSLKAPDGETDLYGVIYRPSNFDSTGHYPVIDFSYTGPHTFQFPNEFRRTLSGTTHSIVQMGFVGVVMDGRGVHGRSKAFRDHSYKRLGYGLGDHVWAIRELGRRFDWIDTTRVGITGHSAGGYDAAHALLQYPEFYDVAVSSSADHDHRMEKAWWPEMYMGWPVDEAYEAQSNITMAPNLRGRLLITHGGIDENVNPSATFKLAEALIRADKPFDMLILPSQRHGYGGYSARYFEKRRLNYFVEHLLGAEPIWDFDWPD